MKITEIVIEVRKGEKVSHTIDEARELYRQLKDLFDKKDSSFVPVPYPVPYPGPIITYLDEDHHSYMSYRMIVTGENDG